MANIKEWALLEQIFRYFSADQCPSGHKAQLQQEVMKNDLYDFVSPMIGPMLYTKVITHLPGSASLLTFNLQSRPPNRSSRQQSANMAEIEDPQGRARGV